MTAHPPTPGRHTDPEITAVLIGLNTAVHGHHQVRAWANQSSIPLGRVVATPDLTYITLEGNDKSGGPIVLMLLEGVWERAI